MKDSLKNTLIKILEDLPKLKKLSQGSASLNTYVSSGSISFYKVGGTVQVHTVNLNLKSFSGRQTIGTIPAGFRPNIESYVTPNNSAAGYYLMFEPDGTIKFDGKNAAASFGWATGAYVLGGVLRNPVIARLTAILTSLLFGGDVDEGHSQKATDKGADITNCIINRLRVAIQRKNFISENWQNGMRLWTIICRENIDRGCLYISRNVTKWVQANGKPACVQPRFNRSDRSRYDGVGSRRWNSENILKSHSRILGVLDHLPSITISERGWAA